MSRGGEREKVDRDGFHLRGTELSRVDGFSDVVFGFALTLLVVSLEVPKTFDELTTMLRGFLPFAICFFFLMSIWYAHFKFFRRFGLEDLRTILLNTALLFVVLFYVYPLKFLFTFALSATPANALRAGAGARQIEELMVLYGLGFAAIYLLLAAMYWNALKQAGELELTPIERMLTRTVAYENAGMAGIGLLSCVAALLLPRGIAGYAGWVYVLIWGVKSAFGRSARGRSARMLADAARGKAGDGRAEEA